MSLLTDTQGRPARVWALVRTLSVLDNEMTREDLSRWLLPSNPEAHSMIEQTLGAARSLGLLEDDKVRVRLTRPEVAHSRGAFAAAVHATLCGPDSEDAENRRIPLVYAWFVLELERTGSWARVQASNAEELAALIDTDLRPKGHEGGRLFNETKYNAWKDWIEELGLAYTIGGKIALYPVERLTRVCRELAQDRDGEMPIRDFIREVALRMPYLDGGPLFQEMAGQMPDVRLQAHRMSRLLALGLRELEGLGLVQLVVRGDVEGAVEMPPYLAWPAKKVAAVAFQAGMGAAA